MEGLLWFIGFAVLFYLMMRVGCGAHMTHGHGGHGHGGEAKGGKDPVCGMKVAADSGYTKVHAGERYWFCSRTCLEKFEADPAKYATPGDAQGRPA